MFSEQAKEREREMPTWWACLNLTSTCGWEREHFLFLEIWNQFPNTHFRQSSVNTVEWKKYHPQSKLCACASSCLAHDEENIKQTTKNKK